MKPPDNGPDAQPRLDSVRAERLYAKYSANLRWYLVGILRDADLAEDVLQMTFVKALESGQDIPGEAVKSWLYTVASRAALGLRRCQNIEDKHHQIIGLTGAPPLASSPDGLAISAEQVERVKSALQDLPTEQQTIVRLRIYENKKFAEIAAELKLPLGTVLTRMHLALQKLRRVLDHD